MSPQAQAVEEVNHGIFGSILRKQSYLNIAYLLLSFPLGTSYFVFISAGLATGIGLSFVGVGLFILLLTLAVAQRLAGLERHLAVALLGARISTRAEDPPDLRHPILALKSCLRNPETWKSLVFLLAKMPLGIFSFTVSFILVSLTLVLLLTPLTYQFLPLPAETRKIALEAEVLVCLLVGSVLALITIHALNGLAALWRALARLALSGNLSDRQTMPPPKPVQIP